MVTHTDTQMYTYAHRAESARSPERRHGGRRFSRNGHIMLPLPTLACVSEHSETPTRTL